MLVNHINFNKKFKQNFNDKLNLVLLQVVKELHLISDLEVNLVKISKRKIKKINFKLRNVNKVTDVLSFPTLTLSPKNAENLSTLLVKENFLHDLNPENNHIFLGDILLCYGVIKKQAKKFNNTIEREMCYVAVHGFLHLLGYNHLTEKDKKNMRKIEENVLSKLGYIRS